MSKKAGEKFTEKYDVESATIYKGTGQFDAVQIPPSGHVLYDKTAPTKFDAVRVEAIDRDGTMTDPIEVWSDPDEGILWVLDGRGRTLDVREVNRRRQERKCELVKPYIVPFRGDERAAILRVREKNYHRRVPSPSDMAVDVKLLRAQGFSWADIAAGLHQVTKDAEQWGRKLLPLAYCIPEVQAVIDAGDLPRAAVLKFGGSAPDGSGALGRKEQVALLAEMQGKKAARPSPAKAALPWKARERVAAALSNGATEALKKPDLEVAHVVVATIARLNGDPKALKDWPEVAAIVEQALAPQPKGPKTKGKKEKDHG